MFRDKIIILPRFVRKVFNGHDITKLGLGINNTQKKILMLVSENSEKSMSEISHMTGLEKSSFTRSVDCLTENGFLTRNSTEGDRRIIKLTLTQKGINAASLIKEDFALYLESLIADFTDDEKEEFFNSLDTSAKYMNRILAGKQR